MKNEGLRDFLETLRYWLSLFPRVRICENCGRKVWSTGLEAAPMFCGRECFEGEPPKFINEYDDFDDAHFFDDEKPAVIELTRGEIVTALRMRKKMTKTSLAQETGLSRNYIAQIEADTANNLSERVLFALADALDINAGQLLRRQ